MERGKRMKVLESTKEKLIEYFKAGHTLDMAAEQFGVSKSWISQNLSAVERGNKKRGRANTASKELRAKVNSLVNKGFNDRRIGELLGIRQALARYHRVQLGLSVQKPHGETRFKVKSLLEQGMRRSAIAKELGLSASGVTYHAKALEDELY